MTIALNVKYSNVYIETAGQTSLLLASLYPGICFDFDSLALRLLLKFLVLSVAWSFSVQLVFTFFRSLL